MVESLLHDNIDIIKDDLQNNESWFNFENSLSEIQESKNEPLPEWFSYDSNGYIVCENSPFVSENYKQEPSPIERIIWDKMAEWEYLYIDYSGIDADLQKKFKKYVWSLWFFIKKEQWHILPKKSNITDVPILEWMKIIPQSNEYMEYINSKFWNQTENQHYTRFDEIYPVEQLINLWASINDIKDLFGNNIEKNFIFEIINNLGSDLDEEYKVKIFWQYSDKIWHINILSWLQRFRLKNKLGDQFNQYIEKFTSELNINEEILYYKCFETWKIADYLLSPKCKITLDNIDEYINLLNNHPRTPVDFWIYTPAEVDEIFTYVASNKLIGLGSMDDENTLYTIKLFKNSWITSDMMQFASTGSNIKRLDEYHANLVEELFINEKEWKNLFYFLSKYPQKLQNLWWKEITEIDLNTNERNFCFRWILEMIRSTWNREIQPYPWENANQDEIDTRKESREKVIHEYEDFLRYYISLDFSVDENWWRQEINRSKTFDKIFYSNAIWDEDPNGAFEWWFSKEQLQSFSENEISDYSSVLDENRNIVERKHKEMIEDICEYAAADQHKNEKILVFIWTHWAEDWYSANGWNKDDWLKISKYPNVKIMTERCYFWSVYNSTNNWSWDYIYDQPSQLSWFSNRTRGTNDASAVLIEWFNKWLWFHEMELYARLHYDIISPLTENLEYTDRSTWEKRQSNIWLAYGWEWDTFDNIT